MSKQGLKRQFEWLSALPLLIVTGALAVIALGALAGAQSPDARMREVLFGYFQRIAPAAHDAGREFQIVLIDRQSVEAVGPWPWPRTVMAELVNSADAAGAKAVIIAEPVDAPDPLSPETIGEFWLSGASDNALAEQLALLPRTDETLAAALGEVKGAVAVSQNAPVNPNRENALARTDVADAEWLSLSDQGAGYIALPLARYFYRLTPALAQSAAPAVSAIAPDADGVVRRLPLLWSLDGAPAPSLALEAARLAAGNETVRVEVSRSAAGAQGRLLSNLWLNNEAMPIPVSSLGAMRLYLPKRIAAPTTSAARLLGKAGSNSQLKDAVVLIGLDEELGGAVTTTRGDMAPVTLHTLAAAQIRAATTPRRPGWTGYMEAIAVMLLGATAIMIAQRLSFWQAVGFAAALTVILFFGALSVFSISHILINPLPGSLALFVGSLSVAGGKSIGGALLDDSVRGSFHDSLPERAMKKLREDGAGEMLRGAHREITVLACELWMSEEDLRQFELLPDDITKLLAAASLDLRQTILDTGGAADQAEGGRIFAYYNAPLEMADHAQAGCAAALRLVESMDKINADLDASSRTRGMQINLAIGAATGQCFIGPMGHGRNNRYSAIGPAVDLAVFLRSQSAVYGPAMICDEKLFRNTHHHFAYLELDKLQRRGEERPFSIYALIGNPFIKSSKSFRALDDIQRQLLAAYRAGDAQTAKKMLDKARQSPGAKIALFDIYEERIKKLTEEGAPQGWAGVHRVDF